MITDADRAHWGVAAFMFSLDLSADLATHAMPDVDWGNLRPAIRDAILWNRQTADAGHPPLYLRDAIGTLMQQRGITPPARFATFVDTRLITGARPANGAAPLLAPLSDPALLARVDKALKTPESYAALVHNAIDPDASDALLDAVFASDGVIDRNELTDWDNEIITRNVEVYTPENPLVALIHTLTHGLAHGAAQAVAQALTPAQRTTLIDLCQTGART
jgi:hypothetical protein